MLIDFLDYIETIKENGDNIMIKEISAWSGINRYTISMAINKHDGIYRNLPADGYYALHKEFPYALELPDDFYKFSTMSFLITMDMLGLRYDEISEAVGIPKTTLTSRMKFAKKVKDAEGNLEEKASYFIYDYKHYFNAFDKIYIPRLGDRYVDERPTPVDMNEYEKSVVESLLGKVGRTDKKTYIVNTVLHGISKSNMRALQRELRNSEKYGTKYKQLSEEEKYYIFTSAFNDFYDAEEVKFDAGKAIVTGKVV